MRTKIAIKREQRQALLGYAERTQFGAKLKLFFMAALALTFAACSNDDNDITIPEPVKAEGIPFTATITVDNSATTRALSESGSTIVATWATGEKVALIYNAGSTPTKTEAEVTKQTDGTATISATLAAEATDGSDVTIIYPASAADGATGNMKADVLDGQVGTLTGTGSISQLYDLRKTTTPAKLKIDGTTASLKGIVSLTNQIAIFKLTLKNIDATADVSATSVVISDQTGKVTTVTPAAGYEKEMYVALPITATTLKFLVTGSDSKKYFNMASSLSLGAKYYKSTVKLATVGDVILSTGKCAKAGTSGAVAKIAYLGSNAELNETYRNGLALALSDVSGTHSWCFQTANTCLSSPYIYNTQAKAKTDIHGLDSTEPFVGSSTHIHDAASAAWNYNSGTHPAGTSAWFLPTAGQWDKMANAAGGYGLEYLKTGNSGDGYQGLVSSQYYWSSTELSADSAWLFYTGDGNCWSDGKGTGYYVRACLAF